MGCLFLFLKAKFLVPNRRFLRTLFTKSFLPLFISIKSNKIENIFNQRY